MGSPILARCHLYIESGPRYHTSGLCSASFVKHSTKYHTLILDWHVNFSNTCCIIPKVKHRDAQWHYSHIREVSSVFIAHEFACPSFLSSSGIFISERIYNAHILTKHNTCNIPYWWLLWKFSTHFAQLPLYITSRILQALFYYTCQTLVITTKHHS